MASDIKQVLQRATAAGIPWRKWKDALGREVRIASTNGDLICQLDAWHAEQHAELIVAAVNSFESNRELIAELTQVLSAILRDLPNRRDWLCPDLERNAKLLVESVGEAGL